MRSIKTPNLSHLVARDWFQSDIVRLHLPFALSQTFARYLREESLDGNVNRDVLWHPISPAGHLSIRRSPVSEVTGITYIILSADLRHNRQEGRNPILSGRGSRFFAMRRCVHVRIGRSIGRDSASFIPPSTIYEHTCGTYEEGSFIGEGKNESDVKPRPDWFTSAATSLLGSRWTCRIYHRIPPAFRSREIPVPFAPAAPWKRQLFNEPPSFSTSSRAPELQHLWRWAWRRLMGHAWCIAKKLRIAGMPMRERFQRRTLFCGTSWWIT